MMIPSQDVGADEIPIFEGVWVCPLDRYLLLQVNKKRLKIKL